MCINEESESETAVIPVFGGHFVPAQKGSSDKVFGIVGQISLGSFFSLTLDQLGIALFHHRQFFQSFSFKMEQVLFQNLPGISPSHGSQLVGLAIVPQGSIQAVAVVAANLEHFWQVGRTAEANRATG